MYFEREEGGQNGNYPRSNFRMQRHFLFFLLFTYKSFFRNFVMKKKMSLYIRIKVKFTFKFNLYFIICMDIVVKLFV